MQEVDDLVREAEALEDSGRGIEAIEKWRAAIKHGAGPHAEARLGERLLLEGRHQEGEAVLLEVIEKAPAQADARVYLGLHYRDMGRLQDAKYQLEQSLRVVESSNIAALLGDVCAALGLTSEAREQFERAATLDPANDEIVYGLGLTFLYDDPRKAAELLTHAVQLDQSNGLAHRELGHAYWIMGDLTRAIEAVRHSLSINSRDAWAHNYLGQILNQSDRYDAAEKELRAAIEICSDLPLFHCNLGDVLARQDRWREAEEEYKRALALDVNYYLANLRYGQLLERMSYKAKARTYAERAHAANPEDHRAKELLQRLMLE